MDWGTIITGSEKIEFSHPLTLKPEVKDWFYDNIVNSPIDLF